MDESMDHGHHDHSSKEPSPAPKKSNRVEYMKFAFVVAGISFAAFLLNGWLGDGSLMDGMRYFMGVFLGTFAFFKFLGYKHFAPMYADYDIIARNWKGWGYAYPFVEAALALTYLFDLFSPAREAFTLIIMIIGGIGVFRAMGRGMYCACLGNVIRLPLSTVSFAEDVIMAGMAALMIVL